MDEIYIEKVLKGDNESFRYFVQTYKNFAFSLAYSMLKDTFQSEEVVQESFVKVYKNLKNFRKESKFQTWLGRIVINESLKCINTKVYEDVSIDDIAESEFFKVSDAMYSLLDVEKKFYISEVFKRIRPEESLSLDLFYLKNISIEEIQQMTGWSASKVKMLLLRGRRSFYIQLKKILKTETKEII